MTDPHVPRSHGARRAAVFLLSLLVVLLARPAARHARAASLLMTFSDAAARPDVVEERIVFSRGGADVPARIYAPRGVASGAGAAPGVVLVHGVHRLGIEEPRLERFARAIAGAGIVVMTPAVEELSEYRVAAPSIDTVGAATEALATRLGTPRVGLMGTSFGGGVSLLAAADPRFADRVSFVVAIGAHDDLERVSRFFVEDTIATPGGETRQLHAHGYGMLVLVHSHAEDFFPPPDVPAARAALRLWLADRRDDARASAADLSPPSRGKIERLFGDGRGELRGELLAAIARRKVEMAAVSPHGRLGGLRASVYLLHGEGDTVIPSTETLWLARDVPPGRLRTALVTAAIEHVELRSPGAADQLALVRFMGDVIAEAEDLRGR